MKLDLKFFCYFVCLLLYIPCFLIKGESTDKSGPYLATLLKSVKCEKPSRPYEKEPTALFYSDIYNTTKKINLLRGNVTIVKDNTNLKIKSKGFLKEDGKWKIHYLVNSVGCKGLLMSMILGVLGVKYDKEKCSMPKGTYGFNDIDFNQVEHMWLDKKEYGELMWRIEVFSDTNTVICWEFYTLISPL